MKETMEPSHDAGREPQHKPVTEVVGEIPPETFDGTLLPEENIQRAGRLYTQKLTELQGKLGIAPGDTQRVLQAEVRYLGDRSRTKQLGPTNAYHLFVILEDLNSFIGDQFYSRDLDELNLTITDSTTQLPLGRLWLRYTGEPTLR